MIASIIIFSVLLVGFMLWLIYKHERTAFIMLQDWYNLVVVRIQTWYNALRESSYSRVVGLIFTGFCVFGIIVLINSDLPFTSFTNAIFWGANPYELEEQIANAKGNMPVNDSSIFDAFYNWIIEHISFTPDAHMLAANTVAIIIALLVLGLFAKEFFFPNWFLPVANWSPVTRYIFGTLTTVAFIATSYFYVYLITSADKSRADYERTKTEQTTNFFTEEETNNPVNNGSSKGLEVTDTPVYDESRAFALTCFGLGMITATLFALYGTAMFLRIAGTLIAILFLMILRLISQFIIVMPYQYVGVRVGAIQLRNQPDEPAAATEMVTINDGPRQPVTSSSANSIPVEETNEKENPYMDSSRDTDQFIKGNTVEEERQRIISKNPLGI